MSINPFGDPAEQLVAQFYAWEKRGRGWQVYPHPVELEPPFRPFERYVRVPVDVDDGRRPGLLLSALTLGLAGRNRPPLAPEGVEEPEPLPEPAAPNLPSELHLLLPEGFEPGKDAAEAFLQACGGCGRPVSFELVGSAGAVSLQLACATSDSTSLSRHLGSLAPDVAILPRDGFLAAGWNACAGFPLIADLGLSEEFMRTLRGGRALTSDPLVPIIGALANTGPEEIALVQVLVAAARHRWAEQIQRAVTDGSGKPFFKGADLVAQAKAKVSSRLFACRIRIAAKARGKPRTIELLRGLLSAFDQFSHPPAGNSLIALDHTGWSEQAQASDLLERTAHRSGMLLSADELASFVHLPRRETAHTALERVTKRTKLAPAAALGHGAVLGDNIHLGQIRPVALNADQRSRHTYIIGGTGTGKSTLLLNLIHQDLEAGHGVAILDPHGDLADAVLARIPKSRVEDVVVIDPADAEHPVAINVLAAHSELERTLLASDLVAAFRRQATSWGDQMNAVLANAVLAFLESSEGGTLEDLRRFLVEKDYREAFLRTVADEEIRYYWQREFPLLRGNAQAPILTRLNAFLRPRLVRNIVANRGPSLDFRKILDERRVLVVRLAQGAIGEENAYLLGALIVSRLQQLALSRQDVDAAERPPFYLYLDEFQHFATPSTATLLSGVRKYGLSLTLAHQNLSQVSPELVDSAFTNAGTRICFRVGESDARKLADGFAFFENRDLLNLDTGQAIVRVGRAEQDFNLSTYPVAEVDSAEARQRTQDVVAASRRQWSTPIPDTPTAPGTVPVFAVMRDAPVPAEASAVPSPVIEPTPRQPARPRPNPVTAGRGGQQHQYLQALIKRLGEERGFKATIEQSILDGVGSVDVALERDELKVACEVWITTPEDNEIKNVHKCLAAGFDQVAVVSSDRRSLKRLSAALDRAVSEGDRNRIHLTAPDELPQLLDRFAAPPPVQTVGGYEVKVRVSPGEESRRKAVQDVIARSLKRLRGQ